MQGSAPQKAHESQDKPIQATKTNRGACIRGSIVERGNCDQEGQSLNPQRMGCAQQESGWFKPAQLQLLASQSRHPAALGGSGVPSCRQNAVWEAG